MNAESIRVMLRKPRRSAKLFSDFNALQFASVMAMVVFVLLLIFMTNATPFHHDVGVDLPKAPHAVPMRGADREYAMKVIISRDGKVYFGSEQISPSDLPAKIQDRLKDREIERKVYVMADMRARWGGVKLVLDGVRSGGIIRVAFLADEERLPKLAY